MSALRSPTPAGWWQWAACRARGVDPDWFYPPQGGSGRRAKAVCARCPVQAPCLDDALATPWERDQGIRAGLTERERQRLRRRGRSR